MDYALKRFYHIPNLQKDNDCHEYKTKLSNEFRFLHMIDLHRGQNSENNRSSPHKQIQIIQKAYGEFSVRDLFPIIIYGVPYILYFILL